MASKVKNSIPVARPSPTSSHCVLRGVSPTAGVATSVVDGVAAPNLPSPQRIGDHKDETPTIAACPSAAVNSLCACCREIAKSSDRAAACAVHGSEPFGGSIRAGVYCGAAPSAPVASARVAAADNALL